MAIFCRGHALLVGVPGLAKTLMVSTLAQALDLSFKRIQFTPDLMPTDITGTEVIQDDPVTRQRMFKFLPGPIFANIVLADEINRTPPKTQAALLEAMQERKASIGGVDLPDEEPVLRPRHAEPHRAGRHLSAARSPARPLPVHDQGRLPDRRRRRADHADRHLGRKAGGSSVAKKENISLQHNVWFGGVWEKVFQFGNE